ncbi:hypothetical protein TPHA_0P01150 [Tetrapisispora phaffii CBS 4417]|uniref:Uncharacterized protein n=1 Tax=Tetrapisispora phaffii (strain ATCC 24235 / CBS 4417 / NBRC 1672 / NRRL Y-8282 / UCD 70-5) TaxID=1071381 RepID=G8C295_TETPH|nr:hypothetical protein TPHA_0P01150 [Tetrapisispora phaffii CBS 4417]CCE66273.1 hypothetical protein TPHA_0P01150 [Tetrapisispora phaffii CBS 4417]
MKFDSRFLTVDIPDSFWKLQKLPTAIRIITLLAILLSGCLFIIRMRSIVNIKPGEGESIDNVAFPIFQMVPSKLKYLPFSIFLSNFVDTSGWKFIVNFCNLTIGGSYIERNWGSSKEMFKFLLVLGTLTNVIVVLLTIALSFIIPGIDLNKPIDGNYTVLIGFPIVYKQLLPETSIFDLKNVPLISKNFRFKLLPIFVICTVTLIQILWLHHFAQLISIWLTFISTWMYLRFFQLLPLYGTDASNSENILRGDSSDTFQFIYLFPDIVKPILRPVFSYVYEVFCIKLRLIRPFETTDIDKGNSVAEQRGAKPIGTPSTEANERRKQKALEVLQERMV